MIDRSYLPYKSAREYADRGMAKWMGFFIAEHTSAINAQGDTIFFTKETPEDEKRLLLSQLYFFKGNAYIFIDKLKEPYLGKVSDIQQDSIYLQTSDKIIHLQIQNILKISIAEELDNE